MIIYPRLELYACCSKCGTPLICRQGNSNNTILIEPCPECLGKAHSAGYQKGRADSEAISKESKKENYELQVAF